MGTDSGQRILEKMLDRLLAAIANGPSLNARPHNSRQRVDLTAFSRLLDRAPDDVLRDLLGEEHSSSISAKAKPPSQRTTDAEGKLTPEAAAALRSWSEQTSTLTRLRSIAEDARDYENDTGVHVLYIGFPLLSLPPGSIPQKGYARRILAPVAFIAVNLAIRHGNNPTVTLECRNDNAELVLSNAACLTWLSRLTGTPLKEIDEDQAGKQPWDEIARITAEMCRVANVALPDLFASGDALRQGMALRPAPRSDEDDEQARIVPSAVLGLYPMANQGLIRDTQALIDGEPCTGPIESFLKVDVSLEPAAPAEEGANGQANLRLARTIDQERLVAPADPCQARAVMLARSARGLVVHGPPGTGKSQTITNIIGDHLSRGQRVLFVCDKRTALDVVMNRLNALGLGDLCAVVHDPRRDQRELYKSIREQLETLSTTRTDAGAEAELARIDRELLSLHANLTSVHQALMRRPEAADPSFHELVGRWLSFGATPLQIPRKLLGSVTLEQVEMNAALLSAMLQRAAGCAYTTNPWRLAAGMPLDEFLATPMAEIREEVSELAQQARSADACANKIAYPSVRPFKEIGSQRRVLAQLLAKLGAATTPETIRQWLDLTPAELAQREQEMKLISEQATLLRGAPLDIELAAAVAPPPMAELQQRIGDLEAYLQSTRSWLGIFAFGRKRAAGAALRAAGLPMSGANAERLLSFYRAMRIRLALVQAFREGAGWPSGTRPADAALLQQAQLMQDLLQLRQLASEDEPAAAAIREQADVAAVIRQLEASADRAELLDVLFAKARESRILAATYVEQADGNARKENSSGDDFAPLEAELRNLEAVLRTAHDVSRLPEELKAAGSWLLEQNSAPEDAVRALRRDVVAQEIAARLKASPQLQELDATQLGQMLQRYVELEGRKQTLSRKAVQHKWGDRQRLRLLAATGTRLNGMGADLRRRLTLQGANAMRLRQVIAAGEKVEGGDPLFDLRPIWMASPETVAEIFPRKSMFDVVVFDEASQCRLEEALPVLLRASRAVIAGDPKQLPPSRFFESAVATSEEQEVESDQQLFESRQGEIEDLLAAALNLEIEEAYLDVHYRSRNSDLIEFSNQHFYGSRLQPIPGHPANRLRYAPLTLYHVGGTYKERSNSAEAKKVCQIVRDLLRRAEKPSIGIACFNLQQRDVILDALEEMAEEDRAFGKELAEARNLNRRGMFEGMFVKNLENVQGDERDHIIISTTYGPDPEGRFYKRFGPLGRAGGGRRLNVLITRAREEVHLVSSIPQVVYRNPPAPEEGQSAGGPLLLYYYLAYAEQLAELYEKAHQQLAARDGQVPQEVRVQQTRYPSEAATHVGRDLLAASNIGSFIHWGNDGFCVDLALQHPRSAEDVTIGVLCDLTRFDAAADPVEWEIFRSGILQSQGWKLHRLWTPHYFRDPEGSLERITEEAQKHTRDADERDAIRTVQAP